MANTITLTNGNDSEAGTILDDIIWSLAGDDTVFGGIGSDKIHGGNGSDKFVVHLGHDTIADFQNNRDTINVFETLTTSVARKAYVNSHATVVGGNTILTNDVSKSVTILGLTNITQLYDDIV